MDTLKYVFPEELPDDAFLQYAQAVWAQFTELAPEELKVTPIFNQFATDLLQLEQVVVPHPFLATSDEHPIGRAQSVSDMRNRITQSYHKLIEQLDSFSSADVSSPYRLLIDGLRTAERETHSSATIFKKQLQQILLLLLLLFSSGHWGELKADATITMNGTSRPTISGSGATLNGTTINIGSGSYTVYGNGTTSSYGFWITSNANATITFSDVSINNNSIELSDNAVLTLILSGRNTITAGSGYAGIAVYKARNGRVTLSGSGSLVIRGADRAAAIGGSAGSNNGWDCGTVTITGGDITAIGGHRAAGIGGGSSTTNKTGYAGGNGGYVTVSGGTLRVTGGDYGGAGIGGGSSEGGTQGTSTGDGGTYIQTGGTVYATGGIWGGAGIGGAGVYTNLNPYSGGSSATVTVSGGYLEARGQNGGAGIGGGASFGTISSKNGDGGNCNTNIVIKGGTVFAYGSKNGKGAGASIGGGGSCSTNGSATGRGGNSWKVVISGGSVFVDSYIGGGKSNSGGPDGTSFPTTNNADINVYRVKVTAFGLVDNTNYNCNYEGSSGVFTAQPISGYFYFWMPTTATNMSVNNITMPVEGVQTNNDSNVAPIVAKKTDGTKYYTLTDAFKASGNLDLQFDIPLYTSITVATDIVFNLNGHKITPLNSNLLTITGNMTLDGDASSALTAPVNMTTGLLNVPYNKKIPLGNVTVDGNKIVYFTEINRSEEYGNIGSSTKLQEENTVIDKQYSSSDKKIFYGWLPVGVKSLNLTTSDGSYFYKDIVVAQNHYQTFRLDDMTNTFTLSQGSITVNPLRQIKYFQQSDGTSRTSLSTSQELNITNNTASTSNSVTVESDRTLIFATDKDVVGTQLTVDAGRLAMKGSATFDKITVRNNGHLDMSQATALTVNNPDGFQLGSNITLDGAQPTITLAGSKVWAAKIPSTDYGVLANVKQDTTSFVKDQRYFGTTSPYYFWLGDTDNDLTFTAGSPQKYLYASVDKQHNLTLQPATYKARITTAEPVATNYYKNLSQAFTAASNGQTITLIDDYTPGSPETVALGVSHPEVTFDLDGYNLGGTFSMNANGGRLILESKNNGKLASTTTLTGLVYTEIVQGNLTGTLLRNGQTVNRYMTKDILATDKIFFTWDKGTNTDQAMIKDGKACLWLPGGQPLERIDLGYSSQMSTDKCGEIPSVGTLSAHSVNSTVINPYLNIARSDLQIENNAGQLKLTHNGTNASFVLNQPVTVYGTGTNRIRVADGSDVQHLTLRNLTIPLTASQDYAPVAVEGSSKLTVYLSGKNRLQGAGKKGSVTAGISVAPAATLTIENDDSKDEQQNGMGELYVKGGANIDEAAAGIGGNHGLVTGNIVINGGTIRAEGGLPTLWGIGIGDGKEAMGGNKPVKINAGSVNTRREWISDSQPHSFQNSKGNQLYQITVNTGLTPNKKYICTYFECSPEPFPVQTDEYGKCYFWMPARTQTDKPEATFRDPATNNTTTIQLVKVEANDRNVAPIVAELIQEGLPAEYHNNLKDAFDAVKAANATIRLLIDIDNLSTKQTVKGGHRVMLDLDRFNLDTKNSKEAGFIADIGGYLFITGEGESGTGNIKSTFKLSGDIYIAGIVPLTDATPMVNEKAVFRTLVKGLPEGANNIYTYSYGSISNRTFYMHDGLACLWLPDASGELTFRVTQGSNVTEYTAGTITTNTQRTEAIDCQPVGVVARVVKGETVQDFNNLPDAFTAAAATPDNRVVLLANIALTKSVAAAGSHDFVLDLNGMSLTGATGTTLTVFPGRYLIVTDSNTGVKGALQMDVILNGRFFVSGNINVKGSVTRDANHLWRTIADVSNVVVIPSEVTQNGVTSTVFNKEACFWLPVSKNQSFTFNAGGTDYPVTGVNINNNHQDNLVTLGVGNDEARITGKQKYSTFTAACDAASNGDEIVLLKDASIPASLTLSGKKVEVDLARYSLTALSESVSLTVEQNATLIVRSSNGNGRMLIPMVNKGGLYIGQSVQADRLSERITNGSGVSCWRVLVTNLPEGMPDDGVYNYTFASQSGTFYVKDKTACLWLQPEMAQKMSFPQFNSSTDNVTIEKHHANQVIWGQSFVAQVQNNMYTKLDEAFAKNSNQTISLLKSSVLGTSQTIGTQMKLEMGGYSIAPQGTPAPGFTIAPGGSLQITGAGSLSTNFIIDFTTPVNGSNANLTIAAEINMNTVNVTGIGGVAYYRTTVTLPAGVKGELIYNYGTQTGKVYAVDGQALTLWLTVPDVPLDMKLTQGQDSWIATAVRITGTHVNPVTVQSISDEASIPMGDGSNMYFKTLHDALKAAIAGQRIVLERDLNQVVGNQTLSTGVTGKVDLDLGNKKLTASDAVFDAGTTAQLIMKNGNLNGTLTILGNVFAHPSLSMNNTWVSDKEGKIVWRTLVQLPAGTSGAISYIRSGDTKETKTANILDIAGVPYACLWLYASNEVKDYVFTTSDQKVYPVNNVIISSNHGNELNVINNDPVVKDQDGKEYASLNTALNASGSKTLILLKDITISLSQTVNHDITLDLNGSTITSSNSGGFNPAEGKTLKLVNSRPDEGMMVGTFTLANNRIYAGKTVDIVGVMRNAAGKKIWRVLVSGLPDNEKICLWQETAEYEYDYQFTKETETYEATIPSGLSDHNKEAKAYKRIVLDQDEESWKAEYAGTNLVLEKNVTLNINAAPAGSTIHRLTLHDGAFITGSGQVQAVEGIRYLRTFTPNRWESLSLPYTVARITTEMADPLSATPKTTLLIPASGTGATGNFWLKTIREDGSQQTVNSTELIANVSYIMAVPQDLDGKEIMFVSTPGQLLKRDRVLAVKPVSGFAPYANGTLGKLVINEPCYVLNADGSLFERQAAGYELPSFRGYLLADVNITASTLRLTVGEPTDISDLPATNSLRIYTRPGHIIVEASHPEKLMIFTLTGHCLRCVRLNEGTTVIPAEKGIYVVNRTKVVVH